MHSRHVWHSHTYMDELLDTIVAILHHFRHIHTYMDAYLETIKLQLH